MATRSILRAVTKCGFCLVLFAQNSRSKRDNRPAIALRFKREFCTKITESKTAFCDRAHYNYERLEAKVHPETKRLAERAASISGITLTDYLIKLIQEDALKTLKAHTEIKLTNEQFDRVLSICNNSPLLE